MYTKNMIVLKRSYIFITRTKETNNFKKLVFLFICTHLYLHAHTQKNHFKTKFEGFFYINQR